VSLTIGRRKEVLQTPEKLGGKAGPPPDSNSKGAMTMSLRWYLDNVLLIKAGPSLLERLERRIAAVHHQLVVGRLRRYRKRVEREIEPELWTALETPMVLLLFNVCNALSLNEAERAAILGQEGEQALAEILETRLVLQLPTLLNERQAEVLVHVRKHGAINLSSYRQLCPGWSNETLRIDLADLVQRGMLRKNGAKRGTYYTRVVRCDVPCGCAQERR